MLADVVPRVNGNQVDSVVISSVASARVVTGAEVPVPPDISLHFPFS